MMKKHLLILSLLFLFHVSFAGKFVLIPVNETNNLETLFTFNDLKIHYYCDDYVLGTTAHLNFNGLVVLDENAFGDVGSYEIVYCMEDDKEAYLKDIAYSAKTLYSGENFFILKIVSEGFRPAKNDGMVGITNTEARLTKSRFDFPVISETDELVVSLISQVKTDTVMSYIQTLENFGSRNVNHANHVAARNWIRQQYESMGLNVSLHNFTWNYWGSHNNDNVIAIQKGTDPDFWNEYIVIGGHYDSYTYESQSNAPGADDDASGSAGILETARILSQYEFKRSIIYCAFSAEEYGLFGSGAYAQKCFNEGMNIIGYFNLDMIGYLKEGDPVHMCLIYPNNALSLANYFVNICDIYFPSIPVTRHTNLPWGDSDHTSFNQKGYQGIWWFEDINCDSPYIHHIPGNNDCGNNCTGTIPCLGDKVGPSVNNPEQVTVFTQAMVASIASLAIFDDEIPPPLYPPTNCKAEIVEGMNIKITWDAPEERTPDEYYVYRDNSIIVQTTELLYLDTVADYGEYCYKIKAIYEEGESEYSNESCVEIVPVTQDYDPPTNCLAENYFEMQIKIIWDAPEKTTPDGYFVYRENVRIFEIAITDTVFFDTPDIEGTYCYKVTALYGEIESEFSNTSCASAFSGITEFQHKIKIYPNPTTGELRIELRQAQLPNGQLTTAAPVGASSAKLIENVEIFDVFGRKVFEQKTNLTVLQSYDLTVLPAGIYVIKISNEMVGKFIKE